jgi:pyruvate dehydrogenase E2 component (dihydrolipoyllysine-residue acetyltransferase)
MPMLGLTMEEGAVAEWLKHEGETVAKDEPLFTVEMDKGVVEVPSPAAGILRGVSAAVGQVVAVKTVIAEIDGPLAVPLGEGRGAGSPSRRTFVSPRARRRARELGLTVDGLAGSGPNGRVMEADVLAAAEVSPQRGALPEGEAAIGLSRIRAITAERMSASARSVARVTLHLEADLTDAGRLRAQLGPEFARLGVAKLPWDAVFARAAALALMEHPAVSAQWVEGQGIRRGEGAHVGVAVALEPEGLLVPVLRDAQAKPLRQLAGELLTLADKARAGRLSANEMQGGTFTITNLGAYRVDGFTPIINPPETAILGVGRIAEKPVAIDHRIEVRELCTLSLSFDHRVVDGVPAAAFLRRLAELLERPYTLLEL